MFRNQVPKPCVTAARYRLRVVTHVTILRPAGSGQIQYNRGGSARRRELRSTVDIQDLAGRAIAIAAHHSRDPRPVEAAGTVPDDGTPGYAVSELRRIAYWSLEKSSSGSVLVAGLSEGADDAPLRQQAARLLEADLRQYPHLVPAVQAFVARAWALATVAAVPADPWSGDPTPTAPWPLGSPPVPPSAGGLQIGERRLGWGLIAALLVALVVLAWGGSTAVILLTRSATSVPDAPVRYRGTLEFGSIDLDHGPPSTGGFGMDVMSTTGPSFIVASGAIGVKYDDNTTPTRAQCHQAIAQFGISGEGPAGQISVLDRVSPGMVFCVSTRNGVLASVKIKAIADSSFTADVTIWQS
jgi:hypothetical protein